MFRGVLDDFVSLQCSRFALLCICSTIELQIDRDMFFSKSLCLELIFKSRKRTYPCCHKWSGVLHVKL